MQHRKGVFFNDGSHQDKYGSPTKPVHFGASEQNLDSSGGFVPDKEKKARLTKKILENAVEDLKNNPYKEVTFDVREAAGFSINATLEQDMLMKQTVEIMNLQAEVKTLESANAALREERDRLLKALEESTFNFQSKQLRKAWPHDSKRTN